MIKITPRKNSMSWNVKFGASSLALMICTACGGGGSSSSSSTPPPVAVNQAPVVSASSKVSVVAEGQPFELDASESTDRDGDALSYSWRQLSGPSVEIESSTSPTLSLMAPMLEGDETLSFEVSVSDGETSNLAMVELRVEDIKADVALSETTEFGTGGPTTPAETVPDPSIYEGNRPLSQIIGVTASGEGDYTVHWTAGTIGHDLPISSQAFSADGETVGGQVDGVFMGGDQGTEESDGNIFSRFTWGITFATVQSGDTLYNFNGRLDFGEVFTIGYTSFRGLVEGEVDGFGDVLIEPTVHTQRTMGGAFSPIGEDRVILMLSERTTDDADDPEARVVMTSYVVDRSGQTLMHALGEYESNGTDLPNNQMTTTNFGLDSYLTAWSQNTADAGYDIRMQRATEGGILLGSQVAVTETREGDQLEPFAVTMADGNIFMAWLNVDGSETGEQEIRARIIRPDGSFATDEMVLGPRLPARIEGRVSNQPFFHLTALNTNEVLLTWEDNVAEADSAVEEIELKALVFDESLAAVSNEFLIATGEEAARIQNIWTTVLPDNRVIMGWYNDFLFSSGRDETSHTVGFYPVGKE